MFFHRKKQFVEPKKLKVDNHEINYSSVCKYLGIFVDNKLNFTHHIQQKIKQAKGLVMNIRNSIGSLWGPLPRALKWAYSGIVLPTITYGCVVFARACQSPGMIDNLKKLNRLMALTMAPVRRSTPTSGLEIILGLPPLHIKIEELALKAMLRILPHNRVALSGMV